MLPCVTVVIFTSAPVPPSALLPSVSCGTSPIEAGNVMVHVYPPSLSGVAERVTSTPSVHTHFRDRGFGVAVWVAPRSAVHSCLLVCRAASAQAESRPVHRCASTLSIARNMDCMVSLPPLSDPVAADVHALAAPLASLHASAWWAITPEVSTLPPVAVVSSLSVNVPESVLNGLHVVRTVCTSRTGVAVLLMICTSSTSSALVVIVITSLGPVKALVVMTAPPGAPGRVPLHLVARNGGTAVQAGASIQAQLVARDGIGGRRWGLRHRRRCRRDTAGGPAIAAASRSSSGGGSRSSARPSGSLPW